MSPNSCSLLRNPPRTLRCGAMRSAQGSLHCNIIYTAYYIAMQKNDPKREAAMRIVETSRLLRSLVEQRLKPFGMTRAQVATLGRLEREEGLSQNEMAETLELAPIAMVRIVDQLEADGLVERRSDP